MKDLVDEGQQGDALPGELRPVQVDLESFRIEVDDGSLWIDHQLGPRLRDVRPRT